MVRAPVLFVIAIATLFGAAGVAGEPLVREFRDGDVSVIRIASADGAEKTYRIDLSHQHSPTAQENNLLKKCKRAPRP
jgi:hypothetical protein